MLAKLLRSLLTRDNILWTIMKIAGTLGAIAPYAGFLHISPAWTHVIIAVSGALFAIGAALGGSPLPHSDSPNQQFDWLRLLIDRGIQPSASSATNPTPVNHATVAPPEPPKPITPGTLGR
jgi:hypothetical protein